MTWPACGMVTPMSAATSGSRPMMTNSPVPMAKLPSPRASMARPGCATRTEGGVEASSGMEGLDTGGGRERAGPRRRPGAGGQAALRLSARARACDGATAGETGCRTLVETLGFARSCAVPARRSGCHELVARRFVRPVVARHGLQRPEPLVEGGHRGPVGGRDHGAVLFRHHGVQSFVQRAFGGFVQRAAGFVHKHPARVF